MGFRTLAEMTGRVDRIDMRRVDRHWKAAGIDLSRLLTKVKVPEGKTLFHTESQDHGLENALDNQLIELAAPAP